MSETPEFDRGDAGHRQPQRAVKADPVAVWFVREILPFEALLMQYLHHNWQNKSDLQDLRQEIYVRVCEAAHSQFPDHPKRFLLTTARNLLIDKVKRAQVVPIDAIADVDTLGIAVDAPGPDQTAIARDELRRLQLALGRLPERCREAVTLGQIRGLSSREIAARMGISEQMVTRHIAKGLRLLAEILYGEPIDRGRRS
jgi:RNA polymerase sigma-70 factor (ECF subfamily)